MTVDLLYVAHNRLRFTQHTWAALVANTDWRLVSKLVVFDDASLDGTRQFLQGAVAALDADVELELRLVDYGSPVEVMNDYVKGADSETFAKIDNDIMVPPGWLDDMLAVWHASPELEALGMEAGRMGIPAAGLVERGWEQARWIGGVGLIRTEFLGTTRRLNAQGRYGWTEHQREYRRLYGWIKPDLAISSLDQIPFEPWASLSADYNAREWQRYWPAYFAEWMHWYWHWWAPGEVGE